MKEANLDASEGLVVYDYFCFIADKIRGQEIMLVGFMRGKTQIQMPSFPACL